MNIILDGGRGLVRYWVRDPVTGALMLIGHHAMRLLPTDVVSSIGGRVAQSLVPRLHARADARARAALQILRPDLADDPAGLDAAATRYWDAVGRVHAEFSGQERMWDEGRVTIEGANYLADARAQGQSVIVAGLHLANWEMLPISMGYLGYRLVQVCQPLGNRFETRIAVATRLRAKKRVQAVRPEADFRLLPPSTSTPAELLSALKAGESCMMFVDEYSDGRVHAPTFGRRGGSDGNLARVNRLARLSGAALIPAYVIRQQGSRFAVHYLPPLPLQVTKDKDGDLAANIAALDAVIEPLVRRHAEDWYMLMKYRADR